MDNERAAAAVRARVEASAVVWQQRRLVLIAGVVAAAASHLAGSPIITVVAVYGILAAILLSEAEIFLARRARTQGQFDAVTLISRVALVTVLALALEWGGAGSWLTFGALSVLIISIAGSVSTLQISITVAYTSVLFVATEIATSEEWVPHAHLVTTHANGHLALLQILGIALVGFPGLAAVVHLRWRRASETRQQLEQTVDQLRAARGALEVSQDELEHLNRDLNVEISRQTSELALRNRYLSVVNAVSTALGEPGNTEPLVGRAARIAARLLGARAAQGWQTATTTEPASTFTLLEDGAGADVSPLPLPLLQQMARRREPLLSDDGVTPDGEPLPAIGTEFAVIPIRSHGTSLGAFAIIGIEDAALGVRERNLLLSVGREIGAALTNAAHLRDAEGRADRVALMNDVARLCTQRKATGEAIGDALEALRAHLDALRASVVTSLSEGEPQLLAMAGTTAPYNLDGRYHRELPALVADQTATLRRRAEGTLPDEVAARVGTQIVAPVIAAAPGVAPFIASETSDATDHRHAEHVVGALIMSSAHDDVWDEQTTAIVEEVAEVIARRLESDAFEHLQDRRIDELRSLAEVARLMQSGADVERLCGGFAQALRALLPYDALTIVRAGLPPAQPEVHWFDTQGQAVAGGAGSSADQYEHWHHRLEATIWTPQDSGGELSAGLPAASGVALPLLSKGQSLGAVLIGLEGGIDHDRMEIVTQAVEQLALALDAASLYQQATSRASQIQTQSNLARIVASQPDLRRAFDAFAEEMRWLVPFDHAVLFLAEEGEHAPLVAYAHAPHDPNATPESVLSPSLVAACAEHEHPFLLRRSDLDVTAEEWETLGHQADAAIIVPVRHRNELMALFVLLSSDEHESVVDDIGVLNEVGSLLAVTIERVRMFERSEHMARHDQLTGLPNFRYVKEHLVQVEARSPRGQTSVLMVDMDNLKPFNDLLGHEVGDTVIRIVARQLVAGSRTNDFVGRIGGDEFVLVMEGVGADEALRVAARIHTALSEAHFEIENAPEPISVSVGVASCPEDAEAMDELLRRADRAMYAAKALGGGRSALARDRAERDSHTHSVGRAGRLTDVLLRSATGNASEAQRTAIALADRYAALAAEQLGLDPSVLPALRTLVIASAVRRLDDPGQRQEVAVTRALLGAVDASTFVDQANAAQVQAIAEGSVELAWAQTPGVSSTPADTAEAVRELDELLARPDARAARQALASVARSDAAERRRGNRVA